MGAGWRWDWVEMGLDGGWRWVGGGGGGGALQQAPDPPHNAAGEVGLRPTPVYRKLNHPADDEEYEIVISKPIQKRLPETEPAVRSAATRNMIKTAINAQPHLLGFACHLQRVASYIPLTSSQAELPAILRISYSLPTSSRALLTNSTLPTPYSLLSTKAERSTRSPHLRRLTFRDDRL